MQPCNADVLRCLETYHQAVLRGCHPEELVNLREFLVSEVAEATLQAAVRSGCRKIDDEDDEAARGCLSGG